MPSHPAGPTRDRALIQLRQSIERFASLSEEVWAEVKRPWQLRSVRRGEPLTMEGEVESTFSLIVEGAHRLYFTTPEGEEHTVAFAYPLDYSGVPDSFFFQTPSAYSLDALSDGWILATDSASLSALMNRHRALERWAWRLFASALAGRLKREREHLTLTAQERYQRLLNESPHILQIAALRHVASYLGMSPETLSRARAAAP